MMRSNNALLNLTLGRVWVPVLCLALGACSAGDTSDADKDTVDDSDTEDADSDTVDTVDTEDTEDTEDTDTDDSDTDDLDTDDSDTDDSDTDVADTADSDTADSDTDPGLADTDTDTAVVDTDTGTDTDGDTYDSGGTDTFTVDTGSGAVNACALPAGTPTAAFTELYVASGYASTFPAWSNQGHQVITDTTTYGQLATNLGATLPPVDFSTHTVVAAWMFATATCGISLTQDAVLQHPNGGVVVDWTLYDSSGGCPIACQALGGVVKVISVSNAGSVDACIDLDGACIP